MAVDAPVRERTAAAVEWPYRFAVVELGEMFVDQAYQRPLTSFVERIKRNFDPALVGTLVLSERADGRYAIIDGQTRWAAMSDLDFDNAPCVVFHGLTQAQEAELFARLQKERRGVLSYHRFRADLVANKPEAVAINRLVEDCGYKVGPGGTLTIPAVAALEQSYRRGADILERALLLFREAWQEKWVPAGDHIKGMAYFLQRHPSIDDERMARRLSIISPDELKRRASALREGSGHGGGSDKYMAGAIEGAYGKLPKN